MYKTVAEAMGTNFLIFHGIEKQKYNILEADTIGATTIQNVI